MTRVFLQLLLMLIWLPFATCSNAATYTIKDSEVPLPFPVFSMNMIAWLDNTLVVMNGESINSAKAGKADGGSNVSELGLYLWDTNTNTVTKHQKLEHETSLCVRDGALSYLQEGIIITWKPGEPEQQRPLPHPFWVNPFSCRYYDSPPPWMVKGRFRVPLLEAHGYLDAGPTGGGVPIDIPSDERHFTLFRPGAPEGMQLAIPWGGIDIKGMSYASFRRAYLIPSSGYYRDPVTGKTQDSMEWPKGRPMPVWWFTPDGKVIEEMLPYHPFMARVSGRGFLPVRGGVFARSDAGRVGSAPDVSGGYLFRNGKVDKVIAGMLHSPVVSPDGCRIAFIHEPDPPIDVAHRNRMKVKMIDLCNGGTHESS